jgi:IclR family pca regulon transcriptional regulator
LVDEELEPGLRAIAVPLTDRHGDIVAALNLSVSSHRRTREFLHQSLLPELNAAATKIKLLLG